MACLPAIRKRILPRRILPQTDTASFCTTSAKSPSEFGFDDVSGATWSYKKMNKKKGIAFLRNEI
jgi:hypothetical protein